MKVNVMLIRVNRIRDKFLIVFSQYIVFYSFLRYFSSATIRGNFTSWVKVSRWENIGANACQ